MLDVKKATAAEHEIDRRFGVFVRDAREALGMTVYEVAKRAGIREHRMRRLERGQVNKAITKSECERLSGVIAMDATDLMSRAAGNLT